MAAIFSALENRVSDAVDRLFGESFGFSPMMLPANVNARPVVDPDRLTSTVTGIFDARSRSVSTVGPQQGPGVSAPGPWLSLDDRQFDSGQPPRRNDRLKRLTTGEVYEISEITVDGLGRTRCRLKLVAKGAAA